jgi:hypothetical protein
MSILEGEFAVPDGSGSVPEPSRDTIDLVLATLSDGRNARQIKLDGVERDSDN